jgi:hypothetical protein
LVNIDPNQDQVFDQIKGTQTLAATLGLFVELDVIRIIDEGRTVMTAIKSAVSL